MGAKPTRPPQQCSVQCSCPEYFSCGCWQNELDLLGRITHPNIVSLLGFCVHEMNHCIVYELMEKGSLESQLHGPSHGSTLNWHIRMKIALDTGLEYLHEHCSPSVIHRDLKSSDFNAKCEVNHAALLDIGFQEFQIPNFVPPPKPKYQLRRTSLAPF
ncbi:hypothetical protein GUJ93_ZPchr0005g15692 [Zizania palustris]|uniref:Protein kinase domain-containing protein n=1 Tax=Zizania palustris TaxID=103762 RepID=A0A8J5SQS4_ZIZPA|nr:hypothetical protein GUJ93_ZPchr0005g15692 [Zizania palustris]